MARLSLPCLPFLFVAVMIQMPAVQAFNASSTSGICGVATGMFDKSEAAMKTFCSEKFSFYWNWGTEPVRNTSCAESTFVPMIWGVGGPGDNAEAAKRAARYDTLMGYNEPDHYAPGNSAGSYAVDFHCSGTQLTKDWQELVTAYKNGNPKGTVISPSMADSPKKGFTASIGEYASCDASPQSGASHIDQCLGWLQGFKAGVIKLQCGSTNCWDAIDVLQFHAYFYNASEVIEKVKAWEEAWAEDLQGLNGRSKKSLQITEFAHAGTTSPDDPQASAFMEESVAYFRSSPYVSGWSWFSETNSTFASFVIDGVVPKAPFWASELIDESGALTKLGETYKRLCTA